MPSAARAAAAAAPHQSSVLLPASAVLLRRGPQPLERRSRSRRTSTFGDQSWPVAVAGNGPQHARARPAVSPRPPPWSPPPAAPRQHALISDRTRVSIRARTSVGALVQCHRSTHAIHQKHKRFQTKTHSFHQSTCASIRAHTNLYQSARAMPSAHTIHQSTHLLIPSSASIKTHALPSERALRPASKGPYRIPPGGVALAEPLPNNHLCSRAGPRPDRANSGRRARAADGPGDRGALSAAVVPALPSLSLPLSRCSSYGSTRASIDPSS
jgi:hypothetical protein